jgi:hypothetical protein
LIPQDLLQDIHLHESAANTNIVNSTARAATILDDFHNFVKPAAFGINSLASSAKYQVKIMPARKDHKP